MKHPISVVIITRDSATHREIHARYDAQTRFPRLKLFSIFLRALFSL
jgi:hypothetical protein